MFYLSIFLGKIIIYINRLINIGNGSTWPGHIALKLDPDFLKKIIENSKLEVVLISGTNGKTTTSTMIATILKENGKKIFQNNSGANLKNGIASSFINHVSLSGKINAEYAILEIDENHLPLILKDITPHAILLLNLFRDQLDRYGELDSIAAKWNLAFQNLTHETNLILNADDPLIANLGQNIRAKISFFGLNDATENKVQEHSADSIYCPRCKTKLIYTKIYYSHLGHYSCPKCKFTRPEPTPIEVSCPLPGTYNKYNVTAASIFALQENLKENQINKALEKMTAVYGRQEKIKYKNKNIQIFLSKNPTGFNQSLAAIFSNHAHEKYNFLFALNDNTPDGRDISWIWDIDFEEYINKFSHVSVSGQRAYDMGLRLQYAQGSYKPLDDKYQIETDLRKIITIALEKTPTNETLYILPTYSAMLEIRKILTGKEIL